MKYKYEDFNDYTLEESLEILRKESKKRRINANDLIIDIEEELKNQDESVAKCNELIQEIVNRLNQDNKMVCPMCQEHYMKHEEYNGTHIYICEPCPFVGFELVEVKVMISPILISMGLSTFLLTITS